MTMLGHHLLIQQVSHKAPQLEIGLFMNIISIHNLWLMVLALSWSSLSRAHIYYYYCFLLFLLLLFFRVFSRIIASPWRRLSLWTVSPSRNFMHFPFFSSLSLSISMKERCQEKMRLFFFCRALDYNMP